MNGEQQAKIFRLLIVAVFLGSSVAAEKPAKTVYDYGWLVWMGKKLHSPPSWAIIRPK